VSDPSATKPVPRNFARTLSAAFWLYGGRGIGLLWTLAMIHQLGIAEYGMYGMGYALFSIIGPPLDNPFAVRAVRESEEHFLRERATRYLLGLALMLAGLALIGVNYIAWFALFVAGGEMVFKSYQYRAARDGRPESLARTDTMRQIVSVSLACTYLFTADEPTLQISSLLFCFPYIVIAVAVGFVALRHRPGMPGPPRLIAVLVGETLALAAYLQGDVLLLGWLTNSTTVGYYTITTVVAVSIISIGQSFGMSYYETLREREGDLSAGPPLRITLILGVTSGLLVLVAGLVLLATPAPLELSVAMIIMSVFCGMRTVSSVFQAVLYTQRRDMVRLTSNVGLVPVKLALVAALAGAGAVGAAIATVLTDAILLAIYTAALYRKPKP